MALALDGWSMLGCPIDLDEPMQLAAADTERDAQIRFEDAARAVRAYKRSPAERFGRDIDKLDKAVAASLVEP